MGRHKISAAVRNARQRKVRAMLAKGMTFAAIARAFGVHHQTARDWAYPRADGETRAMPSGFVCHRCGEPAEDYDLGKNKHKPICRECMCGPMTPLRLEDYVYGAREGRSHLGGAEDDAPGPTRGAMSAINKGCDRYIKRHGYARSTQTKGLVRDAD